MFDDATLFRYDARQAPAVETPIATLWQEFEHNREKTEAGRDLDAMQR